MTIITIARYTLLQPEMEDNFQRDEESNKVHIPWGILLLLYFEYTENLYFITFTWKKSVLLLLPESWVSVLYPRKEKSTFATYTVAHLNRLDILCLKPWNIICCHSFPKDSVVILSYCFNTVFLINCLPQKT